MLPQIRTPEKETAVYAHAFPMFKQCMKNGNGITVLVWRLPQSTYQFVNTENREHVSGGTILMIWNVWKAASPVIGREYTSTCRLSTPESTIVWRLGMCACAHFLCPSVLTDQRNEICVRGYCHCIQRWIWATVSPLAVFAAFLHLLYKSLVP